MSNNLVKNLLSIWIFAALVALGIGLVLLVQNSSAAPEDSKAALATGTEITLGVKQRTGVSPNNQGRFNVNETANFSVTLSKIPENSNYDTIILRVQYLKAVFDPAPTAFTINTNTYFAQQGGVCTPASATYGCMRVDIQKLNGKFAAGEVVADVSLLAKALTTTTTPANVVMVYPDTKITGATNDSYSYLRNPNNVTDPANFDTSAGAQVTVKVEDQCYGDYNRLLGASKEIVDPEDLSRFALNYGTAALAGLNIELDIDTRGSSANRLDVQDLSIFASNYGLTTCTRRKSQGLP